jgi:outer membrane protein insertion porin family
VQQDRVTVLSYLQNEGYADASVDIEVCEAKQKNRIVIRIIADKGDPYAFGKITFEGNKLFCDEDILSRFTFSENDPFSPEEIRNTVRRITDYYGRRGYIDAIVDYEVKLNCENRTYAIHFSIEEGEKFCVGLVKVFGNCSTQTNVILHEIFFTPGEVFNSAKLQLTEQRLKNIGYFKNVNVYAVKSEGSGLGETYRDVHVEVEETITGNFSAGFGFSSVESLFGEFKITEKNFNYKGFKDLFCRG